MKYDLYNAQYDIKTNNHFFHLQNYAKCTVEWNNWTIAKIFSTSLCNTGWHGGVPRLRKWGYTTSGPAPPSLCVCVCVCVCARCGTTPPSTSSTAARPHRQREPSAPPGRCLYCEQPAGVLLVCCCHPVVARGALFWEFMQGLLLRCNIATFAIPHSIDVDDWALI